MSAWLTIPSKRSPEEIAPVMAAWRERGYKIALWRDDTIAVEGVSLTRMNAGQPYPGYAVAVNDLIATVCQMDQQAEWMIAAGDDTYPDPNKTAEEIARQCREHFGYWGIESTDPVSEKTTWIRETFGVMQPTGDRDFGDAQGPYIDRVAGSAWIGREFARRVNKGNGPLWPAFTHMFVDECLQEVATKLGVFWQRPDLTHFHAHWGRPKPGERMGHAANMPEFLKSVNTGEHWKKAKAEFDRLKADGFAECMPL